MSEQIKLPAGFEIEFVHRACPRCGLDLTQQVPDAVGDECEADQVEHDSDETGITRVAGDFEVEVDARLQRMVAPLSQAEKEHANRNEQRWLDGKIWQKPGAGDHEHGEPDRHQDFIPMVKRKLFKWVRHARDFITRKWRV